MNQQPDHKTSDLTSNRILAKNTVWNLIGQGAPMLAALFTIPVLVRYLGTDRFGVLNLAWMAIGYFTMLDMGLGRALTKLVAERAAGDGKDLPALIWTALIIMTVLGVAGAAVIGILSPLLVEKVLKVPEAIRQETLDTFRLLALSTPIVITTSGLRGVLEALQRFDLTNAVRVPMGIFTFVGPLLVLPFSRDIFWVTAVLVAGRCIAWAVHLFLCIRVIPGLQCRVVVHRSMVRPLLNFGGWMMVSNIVSPVLVYLDRFIVGALVSITAVAYYATPWEVVTKFLVVPVALVGVLFPAFSASFAHDIERSARIYRHGQKYVFILLFPVTLCAVTFAREGLLFWLGSEFAANGYQVMQILAVGVLVNAMALVTFSFIQGAGRPDVTARFHLCEAIIYLPFLWWFTDSYGIVGAAIAWLLRVCADAIGLALFVDRFMAERGVELKRPVMASLLTAAALLLAMVTSSLLAKTALFLVITVAFLLLSWFVLMDSDERRSISCRCGEYFRWI